MSRYHSYLNSASAILSAYKGEEPFTSFIKKYFSQHKKFGSKDRRQVSHLCYGYFRLGKALRNVPVEERVLIALFLCSHQPDDVLQELKPEWNEKIEWPFDEKLSLINHKLSIQEIFPWQDALSEEMDKKSFIKSHLEQPALFLRLRPGKEGIVKQKLTKGGIGFQIISGNCMALSNSSKVDALIELDKEAVVQDYSSQRVGELLEVVSTELVRQRSSDEFRVWDCCAASGGKSIMAKDILADIDLIVSDVRESILINLEKRFVAAGINNYESFVADLSKPLSISLSTFNLIIADVPCTGSGTWSRTPEQLYYFNEKKIDEYAALQKQIIATVITQLEPGGYLLYITCSVFQKENEAMVDFIKEKFHLQEVKMELLKGYDKKADTLFAALLKKPL
ncbi:MAG: Fmu (Sun) domain-containing protein [Chitinophagaceae bacterium]|nr:Fmu (Sun) domain-containing protein [Chitinophagaceae bacterium]